MASRTRIVSSSFSDCTSVTEAGALAARRVAVIFKNPAHCAAANTARGGLERGDQLRQPARFLHQQMQGDALRRSVADPGQLFQRLLQCFKGRSHEFSFRQLNHKGTEAPRAGLMAGNLLLGAFVPLW